MDGHHESDLPPLTHLCCRVDIPGGNAMWREPFVAVPSVDASRCPAKKKSPPWDCVT